MEPAVCHVVNDVGDTSMPADLAASQAVETSCSDVGILSWFGAEAFDGDGRVHVQALDIPSSQYRITSRQYQQLKTALSGYDVIHTHHPHSGTFGKLVAKRVGKPVVVTEHNNHDGYTRLGRFSNGVTNVVADAVVCVSDSVYESFRRWEDAIIGERKVSVVPNGIDLDRLDAARDADWSVHDVADIAPNAVVVGSAGMLTTQKAHDILIEAVDRANAESDVPIELVITGDGDLREQLETNIAQATYNDRLHLLGFLESRTQVHKMMHEIDIFAMPSRWEGFCVAALEALGIGNICVFSNIPEFKRPFGDVALFHEIDDPVSLAHAIKALACNPVDHLAERGRELVARNYLIEHTVAGYQHVYREVM